MKNTDLTIGIPTYNRLISLKKLLRIVIQGDRGIKIIIGNDKTDEIIEKNHLTVDEGPNIKIINNKINLGEYSNMMSVLKSSDTTYFTWQFDDDLYREDYARHISDILMNNPNVDIVIYGAKYYLGDGEEYTKCSSNKITYKTVKGSDAVEIIISKKFKYDIPFCSLVYRRSILMDDFTLPKFVDSSIAVHSEFALLILIAKANRCIIIEEPFVLSKLDGDSFSRTSSDHELYFKAGIALHKYFIKEIPKIKFDEKLKMKMNVYYIKMILEFYSMRVVKEHGILHGMVKSYCLAKILLANSGYYCSVHSRPIVIIIGMRGAIFKLVLGYIKWKLPSRFYSKMIKLK